MMMSVWGTLYVCFWRRHCRGLQVLWDAGGLKEEREQVRKEFEGELKFDPITDGMSRQFSSMQRLPKYLISFCICFPCWAICCLIIVGFLNITGAIRPEHHGGALDISSLSHLADPGAICDPDYNMNLVASIAQAIFTTILNLQFKKVAVYTANLENHRQQKNHDLSIFIKRFIFEFTDFQMYLFYIGIY